MDSPCAADSCANYLRRFYILPHTYRQPLITRILAPIMTINIVVSIIAISFPELVDEERHASAYARSIHLTEALYVFVCGVCLYMLSISWRKMTITGKAIRFTQPLWKTTIPSAHVVGYAVDSIRQSRGPSTLRFSIVHHEPGKAPDKTRFVLDPDDFDDPKFRGLFMSMSNFGDASLTELLDKSSNGAYRLIAWTLVLTLTALMFFILRASLPVIHQAMEQLHQIRPAGN